QITAEHLLGHCGEAFLCGDPVSLGSQADFDQGLRQRGEAGRTEADLIADMNWFKPRNPDQAGGIGQIPDGGKTGSPLPCSERARARALLASCESLHSSHLCISPVRGLALACRPSDSRISFNCDCLLASSISLALRSDGALEAVTQALANRFRPGNGCIGQLRKLSGVERTDLFNRKLG